MENDKKPITRTLVIGLGGTGVNIVKQLRAKAVNASGDFPTNFLLIDIYPVDFNYSDTQDEYNLCPFRGNMYSIEDLYKQEYIQLGKRFPKQELHPQFLKKIVKNQGY